MTFLQDQLDAITARTRELVQAERLATSERAVEDLFTSGAEDRILPLGSQAPEFVLYNFNGKPIRLADLLSFGPVVLKFVRGRWCPYCVTELETWRDLHDKLRAKGALLAVLCPQTVRQNDFMASQHDLPFPVLADTGCRVAEQFGASWLVEDPLREYYRSILVNLPFINGEPSWNLPLPATFVLDTSGKIVFAEAHADYRVRPEPDEVMAALSDVLGL